MLHLNRPRQTAREADTEYLEDNFDYNQTFNVTHLTWMTITDTQVRITATTLSPRSLASISRQPVWYMMASVSVDTLVMVVELLLTSQDTGTVCSASFLKTRYYMYIRDHLRIDIPVWQGDSSAAVEIWLSGVPSRPHHGVVDTVAVEAVAPEDDIMTTFWEMSGLTSWIVSWQRREPSPLHICKNLLFNPIYRLWW